MLVEQAVASLPVTEAAPVDVDPADEVGLWELGLLAPVVDEVDDLVACVVGSP